MKINKQMIFITQTNTGTMVKRVPQEQMFVIEATLLQNHFLPYSGFVMFILVEVVLTSVNVLVSVNNLFESKNVK